MKVRLNKATWRATGGIIASFVMLVSFQNCGKAGFDAELDNNLDLGSSDAALTAKYGSSLAAKVTDTPFAFEATFDTITYNSCSDPTLVGKPGYFTLKAGTYATGGIKLKTDFFDYADSNINPIYPETALSDIQYKELLQDSPKNAGAVPVAAIRVKNSLTDVYVSQGSKTVLAYKDVIPLVGTLTNPLVMDSFIQKNVTASYFPFVVNEQRVMEAGFSYNANEADGDSFREKLNNEAILALTYLPANEAEIYKVRAPVGDAYPVRTAYGKSFGFTFTRTAGANDNNNPSRVIASLTERDLNTPNVGAKNWNCSRKYRVMLAADVAANPALCPSVSYADLTGANGARIRSELEIARRQLRSDQWDINPDYGCAVPKGASCYGNAAPVAGAPIVEYDLSKACYRSNGTVYANSNCMHFITICTRD